MIPYRSPLFLYIGKSPRQLAEEALTTPPVMTGRERRTERRKYERSLKPY